MFLTNFVNHRENQKKAVILIKYLDLFMEILIFTEMKEIL